jgi:FKBP-type peptidyl-prolyl cis-trans isomerase
MWRWGSCLLLLLLLTRLGYAQTDTIQTASGLKYVVLQPGQGSPPAKGDKVSVKFTGKFKDGRIFDTSAMNNGKPLKLRLGRGEVIAGWEEILPLMQSGTKLVMLVPAKLAYGEKGLLSDQDDYKIPPHTDLIFEMELVEIKK